jgi:hypothetical protein
MVSPAASDKKRKHRFDGLSQPLERNPRQIRAAMPSGASE